MKTSLKLSANTTKNLNKLATLQDVLDLIKESGYKITKPREYVARVFSENDHRHFTVEELFDEVSKEFPPIGLATIYRCVNLFYDLGIITKLDLLDGHDRYEMVRDSHHHHHLICSNCLRITPVQEDFLDDIEEKIETEYGFHVRGHTLKFHGLCSACLNKIKEK